MKYPKNANTRAGWQYKVATEAPAWSMQVGTPEHGRANLVHVKTGVMTKPWLIPKISTGRSLPTGDLPENGNARVGWSHTKATEAPAMSMQVGTPKHGRANLAHVKTGVMTKSWLIPKISTGRSF